MDAIAGVIKTIIQLKNMLLNVLAKAAGVIGDIIADPIGFLGNLISGIKAGLSQFVGNIAGHLQQGLMGWLTGALGNAGIELPKSFDIKSIFTLVLQVLGLTYANIRQRVVKQVGEKVVGKLEQTVDIFKVLVTEGIGGLWRFVQDRLSDLYDTVVGGIKDFIIEKVIKAGITWLIAFMNPAAAFIKACKAIYDIIMFLIERGSEIMAFVNSVLDSIAAVAKGNIGAMAAKIEDALAKALPLLISFLASLLGLGGISEKVRSLIQKVQAPINKAVDFVIQGAVKAAKKLFGKPAKWVKDKYNKGKAWAQGQGPEGQGLGQGQVRAPWRKRPTVSGSRRASRTATAADDAALGRRSEAVDRGGPRGQSGTAPARGSGRADAVEAPRCPRSRSSRPAQGQSELVEARRTGKTSRRGRDQPARGARRRFGCRRAEGRPPAGLAALKATSRHVSMLTHTTSPKRQASRASRPLGSPERRTRGRRLVERRPRSRSLGTRRRVHGQPQGSTTMTRLPGYRSTVARRRSVQSQPPTSDHKHPASSSWSRRRSTTVARCGLLRATGDRTARARASSKRPRDRAGGRRPCWPNLQHEPALDSQAGRRVCRRERTTRPATRRGVRRFESGR